MEQKNKKPKTLEELKKEKGKTCWAYLIAEEKNSNKTFKKDAQKRRAF